MSKKIYRIIRRNNAWMIDLDQKQFGPYPSKYEAITEAQNCARSDRELGDEAEVITEDTGL